MTPLEAIARELYGDYQPAHQMRAEEIVEALAGAGFAVVPVKPTRQQFAAAMSEATMMKLQANGWGSLCKEVYKAMIRAAQEGE